MTTSREEIPVGKPMQRRMSLPLSAHSADGTIVLLARLSVS
jgi:hypothetical protein